MEKLNELVELAKEYDSATTAEEALAVNNQFKAIATRQTILAIAEAFRALEQAKVSAEHERDCHMDIADYFKEGWVTQKQRAEAAEAKLATKEQELSQYVECFEAESARADRNHAKLAELEKQSDNAVGLVVGTFGAGLKVTCYEGQSRPHLGTKLFTRPLPAVSLAELVQIEWSEEKQPCEEIRYNHITAEIPLGTFSIEWKGWKKYDSRDLYLDGEYIESFHDVEDAKQGAADYLLNLTKSLLRNIGEAK